MNTDGTYSYRVIPNDPYRSYSAYINDYLGNIDGEMIGKTENMLISHEFCAEGFVRNAREPFAQAEGYLELAKALKEKGAERSLDIHIQRQDIFEVMHRV